MKLRWVERQERVKHSSNTPTQFLSKTVKVLQYECEQHGWADVPTLKENGDGE